MNMWDIWTLLSNPTILVQETRHRHLFLGSIDKRNLPLEAWWKWWVYTPLWYFENTMDIEWFTGWIHQYTWWFTNVPCENWWKWWFANGFRGFPNIFRQSQIDTWLWSCNRFRAWKKDIKHLISEWTVVMFVWGFMKSLSSKLSNETQVEGRALSKLRN